MTPSGRIVRAELVVREQRADPLKPLVWQDSGGGDVVEVDAYEELRSELGRLQAAVLGETEEVNGGSAR